MKTNRMFFLIMLCTLILLNSCADLQKLASLQKPTAKVTNVKFAGISFDDLNLIADVQIKNPNALAVTLAGFDYDLRVAGASFLSGDQTETLRVEANGASSVQIPLTVNYKELYQTFKTLKDKDSTQYKIAAGLKFDVPVLGPIRIPVSHTAYLPVVKIPKIKLGSLRLKKLGFTSADLELKLDINNPNTFGFVVNSLNYDFKINNQNWAKGQTAKELRIAKKGKSSVSIPVSLNFSQVGQTVYNILKGNKSLDYNLAGDVGLKTSFPGFKSVNLPINNTGKVKISR
ncbi:MAG: hypothetical protein DWQ05_09120 [Calditrichaeota bacterium]|nr:MAG: hypothetical protein DWQ05_09120 [Calditrichota bacterium]